MTGTPTCTVEVVAAPDFERWRLLGLRCHVCGCALHNHPLNESVFVEKGQAYIVNPALVRA